MNEAETRALHIDPALKAANWGVVEGSGIRREYVWGRMAASLRVSVRKSHVRSAASVLAFAKEKLK